MRMRGLYEHNEAIVVATSRFSTLVMYVYSKTDPEYERNLLYFIQHGMWEGDGCDYVIIVQQASSPAIHVALVWPQIAACKLLPIFPQLFVAHPACALQRSVSR